jgi:hypothetical protein
MGQGDHDLGGKRKSLQGFLRVPVFIDASDGYGDFSYFDEPDGASANPYPAKKLPDTPQE